MGIGKIKGNLDEIHECMLNPMEKRTFMLEKVLRSLICEKFKVLSLCITHQKVELNKILFIISLICFKLVAFSIRP